MPSIATSLETYPSRLALEYDPERLSSGILVGREPHEPTFTRNGRELWVTLHGEDHHR